MKQLSTRMKISSVDFNFVNSISISSSYENLTDTARIVVPKKIGFKKSDGTGVENLTKGEDALFKRGDEVEVFGGYDHKTNLIFKGVLSGIKTKFPLEFNCEDELWRLKQSTISLSMKNPQLSELLKKVLPSWVKYEVTAEQNLGDFRISKATPARVLDELRKKHRIFSFFRDGVLYIGLAVVPKLQNTIRFTMFKDIIDANSLTFVNDFDRKIKVVAKSIDDKNNVLEHTAGDEDGETRTVHFYNIKSEAELKKKAEAQINELKYSGFDGSFRTFLTPKVNHGDVVEIINPQIPEQSGAYIVTKVDTETGVGGGRQVITIKQKVYDIE